MDAFVAIGGCDKNMPGSMIAIANMDIPAIFAYGGTIAPGNLNGKDIDLVSLVVVVVEVVVGSSVVVVVVVGSSVVVVVEVVVGSSVVVVEVVVVVVVVVVVEVVVSSFGFTIVLVTE